LNEHFSDIAEGWVQARAPPTFADATFIHRFSYQSLLLLRWVLLECCLELALYSVTDFDQWNQRQHWAFSLWGWWQHCSDQEVKWNVWLEDLI